jgi:hypothetical protein
MTEEEQQMVKVGTEAFFKPFANLIERLFGRSWAILCQIRQIRLLKKLKAAIDEAGFDPRAIPDNVWGPAFQAASLEDDETMQQKWANLLANAADPAQESPVEPSFTSVLAELTPDAVRFIDCLYDSVAKTGHPGGVSFHQMSMFHMERFYVQANPRKSEDETTGPVPGGERFSLMIDLMIRQRLMESTEKADPIDLGNLLARVPAHSLPTIKIKTTVAYRFTAFGAAFLKACKAPTPITPKR